MGRGDIAKKEVINKLKEAFGENYIGEINKKIYLWANDGNSRVQIAVSLVCPKEFVNTPKTSARPTDVIEDFDWGDSPSFPAPAPAEPLMVSKEEEDTIAKMLERLGL